MYSLLVPASYAARLYSTDAAHRHATGTARDAMHLFMYSTHHSASRSRLCKQHPPVMGLFIGFPVSLRHAPRATCAAFRRCQRCLQLELHGVHCHMHTTKHAHPFPVSPSVVLVSSSHLRILLFSAIPLPCSSPLRLPLYPFISPFATQPHASWVGPASP